MDMSIDELRKKLGEGQETGSTGVETDVGIEGKNGDQKILLSYF
jgi:hypothetical protein